ncbi:MAG: hypothetical protein JWR51_4172 [Devosia sp.]|uniref:DUF1349 domain-containing protein n=1 Tax=Devosia sp. TaxID=1871048 RepID=UPI00262CBE88|nr:DUF1349 domain-containing protein [Devosia sp.]MDB5531069.1 hypothetical protein [Devosia sp.]
MNNYDKLSWLNPPPHARVEGDELTVRTGGQTDFWRGTFYGFWHDSGHFMWQAVSGDFTAEVTISGKFQELYDQAGLMIRLSENCWVKAGIEYTDGAMHFSVVVTNDNSDWSQMPIRADGGSIRLRLTRHAEAIRIQYLDQNDNQWKAARLAHIPKTDKIDVGIMCCSPQREGLEITFKDFTIKKPVARDLH